MSNSNGRLKAGISILIIVLSIFSSIGLATGSASGSPATMVIDGPDHVELNETATYTISVANTSQNISKYEFNVSLDSGARAHIIDASANDNGDDTAIGYGAKVSDNGTTAEFQLTVGQGYEISNGTLGTVTVDGTSYGTANISVESDSVGIKDTKFNTVTFNNLQSKSVKVGSPADLRIVGPQLYAKGQSGTYAVIVKNTPKNISSFSLNLSTANSSIVRFDNATAFTNGDETAIGFGDRVSQSEVQFQVTVGHGYEISDGKIAQFNVSTTAPGNTSLTVDNESVNIRDGSLNAIPINSSHQMNIRVEAKAPKVVGNKSAKDSPDGIPGKWDDVTGDGEFTYNDVGAFYRSYSSEEINQFASGFDFYDDGQIDYNDVAMLYRALK